MSPNNSSATNPGRRRCTEARAANDYPGCLRTRKITPQTARGRPVFALISGGCDVYYDGGSEEEVGRHSVRLTKCVEGGGVLMGQTNMLAFALQAAVCVPLKTKRGPSVKKGFLSLEMYKNVSLSSVAVSNLGDSKQIQTWKVTVESLLLLILMAPLVCHRSFWHSRQGQGFTYPQHRSSHRGTTNRSASDPLPA